MLERARWFGVGPSELSRRLLAWRGSGGEFDRLVLGLVVGAALVVASGAAVVLLDRYLGVHSPSMTFLISVIFAATWFGQRVALATALMAFGVYNFYLVEPTYTFGIVGPDDVLTLTVFVGAAVLIGNTAGRLHDEEVRARGRAGTFQILFSVSRTMAERRNIRESFEDLADGARRLGASQAIVFTDIEGTCTEAARSPSSSQAPPAVRMAVASMLAGAGEEQFEVDGWRISGTIDGAGRPIAVLAYNSRARASDEFDLAIGLLVDLAKTSVARLMAIQQKVEMDSLAATEKLRSALMASMSHDFRTPLSTIMASASSLLAQGEKFSPETQTDLLTSIQEESERLNRFVGNILDMTRLDANALKIRSEWTDPAEVIDGAAARVAKRLGGRRLEFQVPAAVPSIKADHILLEQAVTNVLENALIYTPASATIRLGCQSAEGCVTLWVEDDGPGIPQSQLTRIFDKFHRVDHPSNAALGAGLGLAISKGFVEAMGGSISASKSRSSPAGLRIVIAIPRVAAETPV